MCTFPASPRAVAQSGHRRDAASFFTKKVGGPHGVDVAQRAATPDGADMRQAAGQVMRERDAATRAIFRGFGVLSRAPLPHTSAPGHTSNYSQSFSRVSGVRLHGWICAEAAPSAHRAHMRGSLLAHAPRRFRCARASCRSAIKRCQPLQHDAWCALYAPNVR
jgi:hypothetical protein